MISAIVAVDNDWGIGFNGDLLEHIPEDLKYFKKLTSDKMVVMGRKTWDSLPVKPLPERLNIVITHIDKIIQGEKTFFCNLDTAKGLVEGTDMAVKDAEIFIIGGGSIYDEFLPLCDKVYVTKIHKTHENVDTYFPNLDNLENWAIIKESPIQTYKDIQYQFCQYSKIS